MGRVSGKVALVTGAASGIGRACAEVLAREGATVIATDVQADKGVDVVAGIAKAGGKAEFARHDVTSEREWGEIVRRIEKDFGRLDILVNNAGIAVGGMVTDLSLEDFRRQMAVNVDSVFLGTKTSLPLMRKHGGGAIVNISSVAGLRGAPRLSAYCASKGAVRLFTKSVALECAAMKDGIRVNSVHPGIIETPIWTQVIPGSNEPPDLDALTAFRVPLGVKGQPLDIANVVLFLASDESRYITGEEVVVDGGMTVGSL
ncbi:MAG TPA: glucose 1-dehydrogenase [Hyphomonadaceae bacterium]|nr:glucose 1-dehydrogenase [Hyphomonadaceae bacterium]HPI48434.1 glucose 1-dehydrogenase [Hyphomonadaceae bacterium]